MQRLQEYCPEGVDFLARSANGHLDLPRAADGGLKGGLFAMMARPEQPPVDDLTVTDASYEGDWLSLWMQLTRDVKSESSSLHCNSWRHVPTTKSASRRTSME